MWHFLQAVLNLYTTKLFMTSETGMDGNEEGLARHESENDGEYLSTYEIQPRPVSDLIASVRRSYSAEDRVVRKRWFKRRLLRFSWFRNCTSLSSKIFKPSPHSRAVVKKSSSEKKSGVDSGLNWIDRRGFIKESRPRTYYKGARRRVKPRAYNPDIECARMARMIKKLDEAKVCRAKTRKPHFFPLTEALKLDY